MATDLQARLREAMEGVTPGPWTWGMKYVSRHPDDGTMAYDQLFMTTNGECAEEGSRWERNAAYIALCSPDNIGSLLDRLDALSARIQDMRERAAFAAKNALENEAFDLQEIRDGYIEAQKTGKHAGRNIAKDQAKMYAAQFHERSDAVYMAAEHAEAAIRALPTEVQNG